MEGGICTTKKINRQKFQEKKYSFCPNFHMMKFSCCQTALQMIEVDQFNSSEDMMTQELREVQYSTNPLLRVKCTASTFLPALIKNIFAA